MKATTDPKLSVVFYFVIGLILCVLFNRLIMSVPVPTMPGVGSAWEMKYDYSFDKKIDQMFIKYSQSESHPTSQITFNGQSLEYQVVDELEGIKYGFMKIDMSEFNLGWPQKRPAETDVLIVTEDFSLRSYNGQYLFCVELNPEHMN